VKVTQTAEAVTVSTGPLEARIGLKSFRWLDSLKVDGMQRLTAAGRGLVLTLPDGKQVAAGAPEQVRLEQAGPMKAIVYLRGRFPGVGNGLIGYETRLTFYAGRRVVRAQVWLDNDGRYGLVLRDERPQPEWFGFDGFAIELGLGLGDTITASCEGVSAANDQTFRVEQYCRPRQYRWEDFQYVVRRGERPPRPAVVMIDKNPRLLVAPEPSDDGILKKGERTDGVVSLAGDGGRLTVAVRDFWQNYEKEIELTGTTLRLWLWPTTGLWPRESDIYYQDQHARCGYQSKFLDTLRQKDGYVLPGGTHKGHEVILDFSGSDAALTAARADAPLRARAAAAYYATTEAAPGMFAPPDAKTGDPDADFKLASWNRMAASAVDPAGKNGLYYASREGRDRLTYWFGWMDYGDLSVLGYGVGPAWQEYDWPWVLLLNYFRLGDPRLLDVAGAMARHRSEIGQIWSGDREHPRYRRLVRSGGSAEYRCGYLDRGAAGRDNAWVSGQVLYYMLTGEENVRAAVLEHVRGLKDCWQWYRDNREDNYGVAVSFGDMSAVNWSMLADCAAADMTGEKKHLDDALALFREVIVPRWKTLGPHLHTPGEQIRSQDYVRDDMKYCYLIQTLCELHHHTQDKQVLELLTAGCRKEWVESFFDAPMYLANLYAYVGWLTGDKELMEQAIERLIEGLPESKCPPIFTPGNSRWSLRSVLALRTGHVLQYAFWKAGQAEDR